MRKFVALFLIAILSMTVMGIGAQDDVATDQTAVVEDYLANFDETLIADDAVIYDDAYGVTYDGVDNFMTNAPWYQEWWQDAELAVENIEQTVENQFRSTFNVNLPDLENPIQMDGIFHVDENGQIDDIDLFYEEGIFADTYDYAPVGTEGFLFDFNDEMVERLEDNPTEYYGESVTVRGVVENTLDNRSFMLQDMEPFDLTPAEFLVIAGNDGMFNEMDINEGQRVIVTGVLRQTEFEDLSEEIGWDADDSILGIFQNDTDEFQLLASNVRIVTPAETDMAAGEDATALEQTVTSDYFGLDSETAELVEDNPEVFYGETVTVRGVIENITEDGVGLRVQNREPFDFTPPTFFVVDVEETVYADMNLEEGDEVEVTGLLQPFEQQDWTGLDENGEFPGWDIDDSIFRAWVQDTDEFLMFADALTVIEDA